MNRILLFLISLLLLGCTTTTYFRKISSAEKTAIKEYSKNINPKDGNYHILIMTDLGNMVVKLHNETPLHRDNFVKKVKEGVYDSLMFHRVIRDFMIQGGDPTSKDAKPGQSLGSGDAPGGRIPAEFKVDAGIFHKRGALAAARDNNPEKASSNCQFYIVHKKAWRPGQLDSTFVSRGVKLNDEQRKAYTTLGGTPHLDGGYTVFGELESGFDVLDKIATVKTGRSDRPETDVRMRMFILAEPKK